MPLWKIYHPVNAFSDVDKKGIAQAITSVYQNFMPRFYVGVTFQEVSESNIYIGGEPHSEFIRISIDHIARTFQSVDLKITFFNRINTLLEPWIESRGYDWEMHVDETPFDLWTIQGHFPPQEGTPDERRWMEENRASARTHA
ncbi:tautomerase family protein [Novosphingobium sp. ZN18A2]|uniref:tautomerase family protein n=1 Tax=Novosphingobium sp. ZN18A2 TaxID=3079861 RepID=UPI0030D1D262